MSKRIFKLKGGKKQLNTNKKNVNFLENIIYGIAMGIFEVVPGISGGTLAFIFGIYETLIDAISNLKKDFKKSFKILFPSLMGMGIGIYCFSFIISFLHKKYPMETNFWLTGLIVGIIPSITIEAFSYFNTNNFNFKKEYEKNIYSKNRLKIITSYLVCILTVLIMVFVNYFSFKLGANNEIITKINFIKSLKFFSIGSLASFCLMLPGCSGSLIMLVFGIYYSVIDAIHTFNFSILFPVGFGILFGLFLGAKLISFCLKNFRAQTFWAILGLVVGSSISPFLNFLKVCSNNLNISFLIKHGIFSILFLALGVVFSVSFANFSKKNS